jgi:UDP-2,3-diacylglucosamine pyrophosphatase LpxH
MINAQQSFYFIGDAGKNAFPNNTLKILQKQILIDSNSTVVFLGDNVYPQGIELKENRNKYKKSIDCLRSQLTVLKEYRGNVFFIPGNHDWRQSKRKGLQSVIKQQEYVELFIDSTLVKNRSDNNFLPNLGLPGPFTEVFGNVRMVFIDLDWWLHKQPGHKVGMLPEKTREEMEYVFFRQLDSLLSLAKRKNEQIIVCAHHPLFSNGHHGAKKTILRAINNYSPIGILAGNRLFNHDIEQPRYKKLKTKLLTVLDRYENVLYISGHDHNAQYHIHNKNHYFVSGNGSKRSSLVEDRYKNEYQDDTKSGFLKITVMPDGSWKYHFEQVED